MTTIHNDYDDASADDSDYANFLSMLGGGSDAAPKKPAASPTKTAPTVAQPSWDESSTDDSDFKNFLAMTKAPSQKVVDVPEMVEGQNDPAWDESSTDDSDYKNFMAMTKTPSSKVVVGVPKMVESKMTETTWDESSTDDEDYKNFMAITNSKAAPEPVKEALKPAVKIQETPVIMNIPAEPKPVVTIEEKPVIMDYGAAEPMARAVTKETVGMSEEDEESSISSNGSKSSEWSDSSDEEADAKPAPLEATSLGRGQLSSENLLSLNETEKPAVPPVNPFDAPPKPAAKPAAAPAKPAAAPKNPGESPAENPFSVEATREEVSKTLSPRHKSPTPEAKREAREAHKAAVAAFASTRKLSNDELSAGGASAAAAVPARPANRFREESKVRIDEGDAAKPPKAKPVKSKSHRALAAKEAIKAKKSVKHVVPETAAPATRYFEVEEERKAAEIKANQQTLRNKPAEKPLPVDYFTKLGEKELAEKAEEGRKLAEAQCPQGIAYFTKKAQEEKAAKYAEWEAGHGDMAVATKYFNKLAAEKKVEEKRRMEEQPEAMPAAIQKFSQEAFEKREKQKAEIQAMKESKHEMAPGQAYFTEQMLAEKRVRDKENARLREAPPPSSVATAYFAKEQSKRVLEIEAMMKQPAPPAVEYFTSRAREEEERMKEAAKRSEGGNDGPSAATQHFEKQKSMKAEIVKAAREEINNKPAEKPLPVDYFTKLGDREMEEKARIAKELADAQCPKGIAYFTQRAEEEKARKYKEWESGHGEMSVATKYFNKLAIEQEAEAKRRAIEEPEAMPAAIQKFSMEAFEKREKQKAEIQAMKECKPEMAPGQAYFTNEMLAEKQARDEENARLREAPPPSSVATAYFAKEQSKRALEIEAMTKQPAPPAVEYFTSRAREEEERMKEAAKRTEGKSEGPPVATQHFVKQQSMKELELKEKRERAWAKTRDPSARPSINWKDVNKQSAPEVNLFYTVTPDMLTEQ